MWRYIKNGICVLIYDDEEEEEAAAAPGYVEEGCG